MKAQFTSKPEAIQYMPLPEGGADVWLRKDIAEMKDIEDGKEYTYYEAEEVYFRTSTPKEEIEADFEEYFAGNLPKPPTPEVSSEERIAALEAAILEMAEVMANG